MRPSERYARAAIRRAISRRTALRGGWSSDGRVTLLTVDYHATADIVRLARSFRRFVDPSGAIVAVQNGPRSANRTLAAERIRTVGTGINLHHGLGLDYGMRFVTSEYTLICDPDSAIVSERFRDEALDRIEASGACSIDNGAAFYHPICLGFRTELWKEKVVSLEERWPHWDVAGGLTEALGGLRDEALLPLTRSAGPPLPSTRSGKVHYYGELYADAFTNTYAMSRKVADPDAHDFDGWSRSELDAYHARWQEWVGLVIENRANVTDFPV